MGMCMLQAKRSPDLPALGGLSPRAAHSCSEAGLDVPVLGPASTDECARMLKQRQADRNGFGCGAGSP